jgi:hypothetical protein
MRALLFDPLPLLNLRAEFGGAFLHLAVQLRDPQRRRREHAGQRSHDDQQSFERPPRRTRQHPQIGGRLQACNSNAAMSWPVARFPPTPM